MKEKLHTQKMLRSLFSSDSRKKPSFLLRSALMITLILAFAANVSAQYYSSNGWAFTVLPDGTAALRYPVSEKWGFDYNEKWVFRGYENRVESSLSLPSSVTSQTLASYDNGNYYMASGKTYTVTGITGEFSAEQRNALQSVTFPGTINYIRSSAFANCIKLNGVVLPTSLSTIGASAFSKCTSLEEITIPASVTTIEQSIFSGCTGLKKAVILNNIISSSQFSGCTSLNDVTISDNVTLITNHAFEYCTGLKKITVPAVDLLAQRVFGGCTALEDIVIKAKKIQQDAFNGSSLVSVKLDGVEEMGSSTFVNSKNLTTLDLGQSIKTIGAGAFNNCTSLEEVTIPTSVTAVGSNAFSGCTGLKKATILNSTIFASQFIGCTSLEDLTISDNVTLINNYAFQNCSSLKRVIVPAIDYLSQSVFSGCTSLEELEIKAKKIGQGSFNGFSLVSVKFDGVEEVESSTFANCKKLTTLDLGQSLKKIGASAFNSCTSLSEVTIPQPVTFMDSYAFGSCSGLKKATILNDVIFYGQFSKCTSLEEITIPENVTVINAYSFEYCTGLKDITVKWQTPLQLYDSNSGIGVNTNAMNWIEKKDIRLNVPNGTEAAYKAAPFWKEFYIVEEEVSNNIPVTDISINKHNMELEVGESDTLIVTIEPENATNKDLIWFNSDESVISLTDGVVTALKAGVCYVMVTSVDGNKITSCDIVVTEDTPEPVYNVTSVFLFPNKSATIVAGGVLQVTATVLPENATDKSLVWTSSDETVATVDAEGKISALKAGLATITVTTNDGGKTASIEVSVFGIAVSSVALDKTTDTIPIGSSVQLTATINPSYATDKTIKWTSSDEAVASVDSTGKVYGIAEGKAVITVETANGKTDSCTITVYRPINDVTIELPIGGGESITISLELPAGGFITGSFVLTLPTGMLIDIDNSSVTESLSENLELVITPLGNNTWLVELVAAVKTYSTQTRSFSTFREILNISYSVDKSMAPGTYEVSVSDVNLMLSDGTKIKKDKLSANVVISGTTSNDLVGAEKAKATLINSMLTVDTPDAETVNVYSVSGAMVYTAAKVEGKSVYSVPNLANGIYIVTGSKGWQAKVLKK